MMYPMSVNEGEETKEEINNQNEVKKAKPSRLG